MFLFELKVYGFGLGIWQESDSKHLARWKSRISRVLQELNLIQHTNCSVFLCISLSLSFGTLNKAPYPVPSFARLHVWNKCDEGQDADQREQASGRKLFLRALFWGFFGVGFRV